MRNKKSNNLGMDLFTDFPDLNLSANTNLFVNTVANAVKETAKNPPLTQENVSVVGFTLDSNNAQKKTKKKIDDFGEKIGGAKKDLFAAYIDILREAGKTEIEIAPFSKTWAVPNYEKLLESGIESWKVDAIRACRDVIPSKKPSKYNYELKKWCEDVFQLRELAIEVLSNKEMTEDMFFDKLLQKKHYLSNMSMVNGVKNLKLFYEVMGHSKSVPSNVRLLPRWENYRDEFQGKSPKCYEVLVLKGSHYIRAIFNGVTEREAIGKYKDYLYASSKDSNSAEEKPKVNPFSIRRYNHETEWSIFCKLGSDWIKFEQTKFRVGENKLVSDYLEEHLDDFYKIVAAAYSSKNPFTIRRKSKNENWCVYYKNGTNFIEFEQTPFFGDTDGLKFAFQYLNEHLEDLSAKLDKFRFVPFEREGENAPRTGLIRREGNITPEMFQETFGFRGVEFGNWVENDTRQEDLNKAYDALLDLSSVLKIPPKALSLDGSLGLAFGARGSGGKNAALAHYEPAKTVINLTKKKGAGSLAHEWFHAMDYYFGDFVNPQSPFKESTLSQIEERNYKTRARSEVVDSFKNLKKAIESTDLVKRSKELDKRRSKPYWATIKELGARCFESYVSKKLADADIKNDYLVKYGTQEYWDNAVKNGYKLDNTYPYPNVDELPVVNFAFESMFDTIRFREHNNSCQLYSVSNGDIKRMKSESSLAIQGELNNEQMALQVFSQEVFDINLKYFTGPEDFHGMFDKDLDILYLNTESEIPLEWTFWHEAFHVLKKYDEDLYNELLNADVFSQEQMDAYRKSINRPTLPDEVVMEELLADAFADVKTGRRVIENVAVKNPTLAQKLTIFVKKLSNHAKKFFSDEVQNDLTEKYPKVKLNDSQFKNFAEKLDSIVANVKYLPEREQSTAHKIMITNLEMVHSPYSYSPKNQFALDKYAINKLSQKFSRKEVIQAVSNLSPFGRKPHYVDKLFSVPEKANVKSPRRMSIARQ